MSPIVFNLLYRIGRELDADGARTPEAQAHLQALWDYCEAVRGAGESPEGWVVRAWCELNEERRDER